MTANALIYMGLSPALILGWGPFPPLGIAGAAVPSITAFGLGALALMGFLLSGRSLVRPTLRGVRLRGALFCDILRVGAGALNTVLTNLTFMVRAGLVGPFRATSLAGYGMARMSAQVRSFVPSTRPGLPPALPRPLRERSVLSRRSSRAPGSGLQRRSRRAGLRHAVSQHRRPGLRLLRCRPGPSTSRP
jgi:hypothetical protein